MKNSYAIRLSLRKSLGKLGNIVAETLCFLSMFPCTLPTSGTLLSVVETKFASQEGKMFPNKFINIFVAETMFLSLPTCFQMYPVYEKHCFPEEVCQCLKL